MDYKLEMINCGTYLKCSVEGADSFEVSLNYWTEISKECFNQNISKVLLLENLEGNMGTADIFRLNELLPDVLAGLKIAFVDLIDHHHEDNIFGESCAANRGIMISIFKNEKTAENWLLDIKAS